MGWTVGRSARRVAFAALAALGLASRPARAADTFGFNVHQSLDTGVPAAAACGGRLVRIDFNWYAAEPSPGVYDWAVLDALIDGARAKGLTVLATIGYSPAWASRANVDGKETSNDVPKPGLYEAFVKAAVTRFKDRVQHWELWNEPNLGEFFEGTAQDYTDLVLRPGARAVHAACPGCKTLGPDVATIGKDYADWMKTTLTQAGTDVDIVSGHIYADFPPIDAAPDPTAVTFFSKLEAHRVLMLGSTVVYEDPLSLREAMLAAGVGTKPFWLTETGKKARFGDAAQMTAQATYARRVLEAQLLRTWWQATVFYEAFDEPGTTYDYGFTLRDPKAPAGFQQKPACALTAKAAAQQPAFGGKGTDCTDGLDNEGDGKIDWPDDPDCTSAAGKSEGDPPPPPDAGAEVGEDATADGGGEAAPPAGGCGCHTPRRPASGGPLLLGLLALLRRRCRSAR